MAVIAITKGQDISMVQVFDPDHLKKFNQEKMDCIKESRKERKKRNAEPKTYSRQDIASRNNKLIKERIKSASGYQCFLTLLLPEDSMFNNVHDFSMNIQRFASWFKRHFCMGYADFWFELSNIGTLHAHMNVHTGQTHVDIKSIEKDCYLKWSALVKSNDKKICKATMFNKYQLTYMSRKAKRSRTYDLMNMFQHKKSYGTINKDNKKIITAHVMEIDQIQQDRIANYFINKMKHIAKTKGQRLNIWQTSRIRSGFYCQLAINDVDVSMVYYLVFYDELRKIYGEPDLAFDEVLRKPTEWPDMSNVTMPEPDEDDDFPFASDEAEWAYYAWEEQHFAGAFERAA